MNNYCTFCGKKINSNSFKCPDCQTPTVKLDDSRPGFTADPKIYHNNYCRNCGELLNNEVTKCNYCDTEVINERVDLEKYVQQTNEQNLDEEIKRSEIRVNVGTTLAVIFLIATIVTFINCTIKDTISFAPYFLFFAFIVSTSFALVSNKKNKSLRVAGKVGFALAGAGCLYAIYIILFFTFAFMGLVLLLFGCA